MSWIIQFLLFGVAGFYLAKYLSGKKEGDDGKFGTLRWKIGEYTLWLHHWIFSAIGLFVCYYLGIYNAIIYGLLFGIMTQGLYYKDFYYIFFKTKNYPYKKL